MSQGQERKRAEQKDRAKESRKPSSCDNEVEDAALYCTQALQIRCFGCSRIEWIGKPSVEERSEGISEPEPVSEQPRQNHHCGGGKEPGASLPSEQEQREWYRETARI